MADQADNKTPEQLEQERLAAEQEARERQEQADREAAEAAAQAPKVQPRQTRSQPAPKVQKRETKSEQREGHGELTRKAEEMGTISDDGTTVAPGVIAANTVPASTSGEMVTNLPGTNTAAVDTNVARREENTAAYLGGEAAQDQVHPRPPAYGSPGYDVWMFENRQSAARERRGDDK